MSSHADAGLRAFNASKYDEAVVLYTKALEQSDSPIWLIQRSTAYQRIQKYDLALADAEAAFLCALHRGKRDLMGQGQFRRATALFKLQRYGDARMCLAWARAMNDRERGLSTWTALVVQEYDKYPKGDPKLQVTVNRIPKIPSAPLPSDNSSDKPSQKLSENTAEKVASSSVSAAAQTPLQKIRYEWYQSNNIVNVSIMAKNIAKDAASVNFGAREVRSLSAFLCHRFY